MAEYYIGTCHVFEEQANKQTDFVRWLSIQKSAEEKHASCLDMHHVWT